MDDISNCVNEYNQRVHNAGLPILWLLREDFMDPSSRIEFLQRTCEDREIIDLNEMYLTEQELVEKVKGTAAEGYKDVGRRLKEARATDIAALLFCMPPRVARFHLRKGERESEPLGGKPAGRWWDKMGKKKGVKWRTLRQNGPFLPPPYEALPKKVMLKFKGKPVKLSTVEAKPLYVSAEEAAVFFAKRLFADKRVNKPNRTSKDAVFQKNFYKDWATILKKGNDTEKKIASEITKLVKKKKLDFSSIDFSDIVQYLEQKETAKKEMSKEAKKEERKTKKLDKAARDSIFGWCQVDDVSYPVSYAVQIPGIFIGKSGQPKRGKIKKRVRSTDITLNLSPKKDSPKAYGPDGQESKWKDITTEKDSTWLAKYKNNITGEDIYIRINRNADPWVGDNDFEKFEKARKLGKIIAKIRSAYRKGYKGKDKLLAAAVFLLDKVAIRPGSEGNDGSGTTGLTTLLCENIKSIKAKSFVLDFTGKSSIPFRRKIDIDTVDKPVLEILRSACDGKKKKDQIWKSVTPSKLNAYLKSIGKNPDLTAKVFRTWTASTLLSQMLDDATIEAKDPIEVKKDAYFFANLAAAKALNHKTMTETAEAEAKIQGKIDERIEKYQKKFEAKEPTPKQKASHLAAIKKLEQQLKVKQENISLSTSRVNYMDPRITVAWAKKHGVPLESGVGGAPLMNKSMLTNAVWAMETPSTWGFNVNRKRSKRSRGEKRSNVKKTGCDNLNRTKCNDTDGCHWVTGDGCKKD